ncbi:hypothetical protein Y1Q_0011156 [Alligator mississippiensis]|uniref:Uncharacterized protein n=1 Tax=Alligator mississippiensis TaxID=8496 RepID=A0A151MRM7_ALLMI|nr:hypothetical protein Y1Q_0011156 [Alligator mississippiensis]
MPRARGWMGHDARGGKFNNAPPTPLPAQCGLPEAAVQEQELVRQDQAKLKDQRRSHEEHVRQLEEMLQLEQKVLLEELDQIEAQTLWVQGQEGGRTMPRHAMPEPRAERGLTRVFPQEELLRERFQEESSGTEGELHQLQEESPAMSRPGSATP